jgi:hypothetical protein
MRSAHSAAELFGLGLQLQEAGQGRKDVADRHTGEDQPDRRDLPCALPERQRQHERGQRAEERRGRDTESEQGRRTEHQHSDGGRGCAGCSAEDVRVCQWVADDRLEAQTSQRQSGSYDRGEEHSREAYVPDDAFELDRHVRRPAGQSRRHDFPNITSRHRDGPDSARHDDGNRQKDGEDD